VNNINVNKGNRPANKASQSDSLRKQQYKKTLDNQHHVSMDEFLAANPSVKEYIKVLADKIIKEQIDKVVWRKQNQRISIPDEWT
jgi:hypothetical protein